MFWSGFIIFMNGLYPLKEAILTFFFISLALSGHLFIFLYLHFKGIFQAKFNISALLHLNTLNILKETANLLPECNLQW